MRKALKRRTAGGGPLMTLLVLLLFFAPVISLGWWLTFTSEGRASLVAEAQFANQ